MQELHIVGRLCKAKSYPAGVQYRVVACSGTITITVDSDESKGPKTLPCVMQQHIFILQLSLCCSTPMCRFSDSHILTLCLITRAECGK